MGRPCTVCRHKDLARINNDLAHGVSYRTIARQYNLNKDAVGRHAELHLPGQLAQDTAEDRLIDELGRNDRALSLRDQAESTVGDRQRDDEIEAMGLPPIGSLTLDDVMDIPRELQHSIALINRYLKLNTQNMYPSKGARLEGVKPNTQGVDIKGMLAAIREKSRIANMLLRATGEIQEAPTVNILLNPVFVQLKAMMIEMAEEHPEMKARLIDQLDKLETLVINEAEVIEGTGTYR